MHVSLVNQGSCIVRSLALMRLSTRQDLDKERTILRHSNNAFSKNPLLEWLRNFSEAKFIPREYWVDIGFTGGQILTLIAVNLTPYRVQLARDGA